MVSLAKDAEGIEARKVCVAVVAENDEPDGAERLRLAEGKDLHPGGVIV